MSCSTWLCRYNLLNPIPQFQKWKSCGQKFIIVMFCSCCLLHTIGKLHHVRPSSNRHKWKHHQQCCTGTNRNIIFGAKIPTMRAQHYICEKYKIDHMIRKEFAAFATSDVNHPPNKVKPPTRASLLLLIGYYCVDHLYFRKIASQQCAGA